MIPSVSVIGGGLAGVECAGILAENKIPVTLYEMKPERFSPAHSSSLLAEIVCSNSFKEMRLESAAGLLKEEMLLFGSLTVECAYASKVEAGGALAVDRDRFSSLVTERINENPFITVVRKEMTDIPGDDFVIIATGPLTSDSLSEKLKTFCGEGLSFFDAAAPIITGESVDENASFKASRYGRGGEDDYINCPLNKEEYENFHRELINAERAEIHSFEKGKNIYEGCMPIEILASRGTDAIRFGPMKPVGLVDPRTGHRPWACLQLRKENSEGSLLNLVGFQTNLKFGEQKRVFSMIPALKNAEFVRYGVMHRNTFIDSPRLLNPDLSLKSNPRLFFAGQITGVEGYMESASSGILAGLNCVRRIKNLPPLILPVTTMMGALTTYISDGGVTDFQPMGANFGILPPLEEKIRDKKLRYAALSNRSLEELKKGGYTDERP